MNITKRKPVSVGEMLVKEFMEPLHLTQNQLAEAMGVTRRTVNELCNNKRTITVDTALMLAAVFGNTSDFWLNLQRRNDLWKALNTPKRYAKLMRVKPIDEDYKLAIARLEKNNPRVSLEDLERELRL